MSKTNNKASLTGLSATLVAAASGAALKPGAPERVVLIVPLSSGALTELRPQMKSQRIAKAW